MNPGLLSMIMRIVLWGIMFKYAFAALKSTAQGNLSPPPINLETLTTDFFQVFKRYQYTLLFEPTRFWFRMSDVCCIDKRSGGPKAVSVVFLYMSHSCTSPGQKVQMDEDILSVLYGVLSIRVIFARR